MPHLACLNDEQDIVQLLLEAGSNIYAKNLHNCMPAHLAVKVCESSCIPHFLLLVERHIKYRVQCIFYFQAGSLCCLKLIMDQGSLDNFIQWRRNVFEDT